MGTDATPRCWICNQSVVLEDCKIDERGHPVHEDCYVALLARHDARSLTDAKL